MNFRQKLFRTKKLYDTSGTEQIFLQAVKENYLYQYNRCPSYRAIADSLHFTPEKAAGCGSLAEFPVLPTVLFKKHRLFSIPEKRLPIKATSSGTKGKYSKIGFELSGLWCGLKMVLKTGRFHRLFSLRPAHYIVLGYKPHKGNHTAVTKTAFGATLFTPACSRTYALTYRDGAYQLDLEQIVAAIQKHAGSRFPTRFMGFPSYTYFVLKMMDERNLRVKLPSGSKIMLGGGWKQFYADQVDKHTLYMLAKKVLNIEEKNIIEFFGAVEHPILYCDCKNHRFHIPAYSRVIIRDICTLEPLGFGKTGLINLITPMVKATPILSVMTDDLGVLHDGKNCGCGITSPYLEIIGRVGLQDIKTCAAGAADILKGEKG